mgnify:FL=1
MNKIKRLIEKISFIITQVFKASPKIGLLCTLTILIDGGLPILQAYILKRILFFIENYSNNFSETIFSIISLLLIEFLAISTQKVINNYRSILGRIASMKITYRMQDMILNKLKKIPFCSFDNPEFHNLYSNAQGQTNASLANFIVNTFGIISFVVTLVSFSIIVINYNVICFFLIILTSLPTLFFKFGFQGKLFELVFKDTKIQREQNYCYSLMTSPGSLREVKIFNLYSFFQQKRDSLFKEHYEHTITLTKKELSGNLFVNLFAKLGTYISVIILIYYCLLDSIPISDFTMILTAITSIESTLYVILEVLASNHNSLLFLDYFFNFINYPEKNFKKEYLNIKKFETLELKQVSFRYPNTEKYLFTDFSLKITSGDMIAIVGENGSGKSTLFKLFLRLYTPTQGEVLINGIDIKNYSEESLYKLFSPVFQDFTKFAATIKENIFFGNTEVEDVEKMLRALKITNLYDFTMNLSEQYNSPLTKLFFDNGEELSIGQWQKISIARSIYSNANILVLDEPSAALDPETENRIIEYLLSQKGKRTILIITHRLSYLKNVDRVIFFTKNDGIKIGNHNVLYKNSCEYRHYYDNQADKYK